MSVNIEAATDAWQDTGLLLVADHRLKMTVTGSASPNVPPFGNGPEGASPADPENETGYPVPFAKTQAYGLTILVLHEGDGPPDSPSQGGSQITAGVLTTVGVTNAEYAAGNIFSVAEIAAAASGAAPWRIWARMNDDVPGDNSGHWTLLAEDAGPTPIPVPTLSGEPLLLPGDIPAIQLTGV